MPTKIEIIYDKIKREIEEIKENHNYNNLSNAFGHFFIKNLFNIDDQQASETLTDGGNDNGIDAIYISNDDEKVINFFQFKFPRDLNTINKGFTEEEITKLESGVREFLSNDKLEKKRWNNDIIDKHREVRELSSYDIKLLLVRFTTSEFEHLENKLKHICTSIKKSTLNECTYSFYAAEEISKLYEARYEKKYPNITISSYTNQIQMFDGDIFKSINIVCSIEELYNSIKDKRNQMFDGNVRYYDSTTEVTKGIKRTLLESPEKFIVLNNGITILTEKVEYNMNGSKFFLTSASIINGAQTVGTILDVFDDLIKNGNDLDKYKNSTILIRILEVKDKENLINEIVNSLNTQTRMFSAYNISNDSRLKEIQQKLNKNDKEPYFLEIKYNEYNTQKYLEKTKKYKKNVITSEKLIQIYVGYYNKNDKASIAKSQSSELLSDSKLINTVLDNMDYKETINIIKLYYRIQKVITMFRGYRNYKKTEIIEYLEIEDSEIDDYQFLTTGDILILYVVGLITETKAEIINNEKSIDKYIKEAIELIQKYIKDNIKVEKRSLSNITKAKNTFKEIKKMFYDKKNI